MLTILKLPWILLTFPVRLLWRVYMGLWWAFDDSSRSRTQRAESARIASGQEASFEVVDSTPRPRPAPRGLLRAGFAASAMVAVLAGVGLSMLSAGRAIDPASAAIGWVWATAVTMVVSVSLVRRKAAKQRTLRERVASCARQAASAVRDGAAAFVGPAPKTERPPAPADPTSADAGAWRSTCMAAGSCAKRCCKGAWNGAQRGAAFVRARTPEASRRVGAAWSALRKGPVPSAPATRRG